MIVSDVFDLGVKCTDSATVASTLRDSELLFELPERSGAFDLLTGRQRRKGLETEIDTDRCYAVILIFWHFDMKIDPPLT
jgi:hypothetical protein